LASTDADRDLSELVYSGLLRASAGGYVDDLASSYSVSPDGLTYTVTIRPNATFQDGTPVTADDVIYTVEEAQNPVINSVKQVAWEGVGVEKIDEHTVRFTLKQPYEPFLENLTLGILPSHLWQNVSDDQFASSPLNVHPVGSGPYQVKDVVSGADGLPSAYNLEPFSNFALGKPYIGRISLIFYPTEPALLSALNNNSIESTADLSEQDAATFSTSTSVVETSPLPRIYAVFFNQSQNPIFGEPEVREALDMSVDRVSVINQALDGYGLPIDGPLPTTIAATSTADIAGAQALLEQNGWTLSTSTGVYEKKLNKLLTPLSFTLTTGNSPELVASANALAAEWQNLGASVTVKTFNSGDLNQAVIAPRDYDALLFGEALGRLPDLYAFWDSAERTDPGLNVALYTNATADQELQTARSATSTEASNSALAAFASTVSADNPAVFLYEPDLIYLVPKNLKGLDLENLSTPSDRFLNVYQWYFNQDYVWPMFSPKISYLKNDQQNN